MAFKKEKFELEPMVMDWAWQTFDWENSCCLF